jgi:VTC domain-containing protein
MNRQVAVTSEDSSQDGITARREEVKYLIEPAQLAALVTALGRSLPAHRFAGAGNLPRPRHFVTTVYFDTPARHQFRAARDHAQPSMKMRAKEYYDLHPSLAELATDPRQIVQYQPALWLELKLWDGTTTSKRRIGIPKHDVPAFFADGLVTAEMIELQRPLYGAEGERVLREIAAYCGRYGQPFRADCLANYRRLPWQDAGGQLRVTLAVGVEFYPPPVDLWQREHALVRESLGPARGRQTSGVLEIKSREAWPPWLAELLERLQAQRCSYSKFEEASLAVHGSSG